MKVSGSFTNNLTVVTKILRVKPTEINPRIDNNGVVTWRRLCTPPGPVLQLALIAVNVMSNVQFLNTFLLFSYDFDMILPSCSSARLNSRFKLILLLGRRALTPIRRE